MYSRFLKKRPPQRVLRLIGRSSEWKISRTAADYRRSYCEVEASIWQRYVGCWASTASVAKGKGYAGILGQ